MTVETFTARRAYQIAAAYRRRGVPVVMGGHHPSLLPEEALAACRRGRGRRRRGRVGAVLADAAAGRLQPLYPLEPRRAGGPPATTAASSAASAMRRSRWSSRARLPLRLRLLLDPRLLRHLPRPARPGRRGWSRDARRCRAGALRVLRRRQSLLAAATRSSALTASADPAEDALVLPDHHRRRARRRAARPDGARPAARWR